MQYSIYRSNPFTIRIYLSEGDPEGVRIIDRLSSAAKFFAFSRDKWNEIKNRHDFMGSGIYILSGYSEKNPDLPTIYVGQAGCFKCARTVLAHFSFI